jgi:hypothetical protein
LGNGDTLILYSDGVSEAFNPQEECYGDQRLLADVMLFVDREAAEIASGLLGKVRAFAGTAPQSDDIAILILKLNGPLSNNSVQTSRVVLQLHATPEEVMRAVETFQQFAPASGMPKSPSSAWHWRWRNRRATSSITRCNATPSNNSRSRSNKPSMPLSSNCAMAALRSTQQRWQNANRRARTMICPAAGASS